MIFSIVNVYCRLVSYVLCVHVLTRDPFIAFARVHILCFSSSFFWPGQKNPLLYNNIDFIQKYALFHCKDFEFAPSASNFLFRFFFMFLLSSIRRVLYHKLLVSIYRLDEWHSVFFLYMCVYINASGVGPTILEIFLNEITLMEKR